MTCAHVVSWRCGRRDVDDAFECAAYDLYHWVCLAYEKSRMEVCMVSPCNVIVPGMCMRVRAAPHCSRLG